MPDPPLTIEQARTLAQYTPLKSLHSVIGLSAGRIVLFNGIAPDDPDYVQVLYGDCFVERTNKYPNRFALYQLDRGLVATDLSSLTNETLQRFAFRHGYRWAGTHGQVITNLDQTELLFKPDERLIYINPTSPGCLYISAVRFMAAIQMLIAGSHAPQTIERILPANLLSMIRSAPENPLLRGLIRSACGKAVPKETIALGSEPIIAWLMDAFKGGQPIPVSSATLEQATQTPGPTYPVPFTFHETEYGTCTYQVRVHYSGIINVPAHVMSEGPDAIDDYIRDRCTDGEDERTDYEYDDYDQDGNNDGDLNYEADDAIAAYERDHPQPALDTELEGPDLVEDLDPDE